MTSVQKIFIGVFLAGLLGFLLPAGIYWRYLIEFAQTAGSITQPIEIEIQPGSNSRQIGKVLEEKGVITSAQAFYHYLRFIARNGPMLQAGDYEFLPGQTPDNIIAMLQKGRRKEIKFTIPEGANKQDIAVILENAGFGSKEHVLDIMNNPDLIRAFGVPQKGLNGQTEAVTGGIEGYLFPDTYQFPKRTDVKLIVERMHDRLHQVLDDEMNERLHESGMSLHQVLTLASIVEKETGDPTERPQIASVFFNRLQRRMKLQTDPTVIYSISNYEGKISKAHLRLENPYNTYVREGLPPGPIASPGIEAIRAVLWPASTPFLYFVSRNDGTHVFCPNYQCHQHAVKLWQIDFFKERRRNEASSMHAGSQDTTAN